MKSCSGVLFRAFLGGATGYSAESAGALLSIPAAVPVELRPLNRTLNESFLPADLRNRISAAQRTRLWEDQSLLFQCCSAPDFDLITPARSRVGRTTFETDRLPEGWMERCLPMDEIWVPSTFNAGVFAECGIPSDRIRVLPIGIDSDVFRPGVEPLDLPHARSFRFLSVFDWHDRKGPDILIEAFISEFGQDEDVCLILKVTQNVDRTFSIEERIVSLIERISRRRLENVPPILLIRGNLPQGELAGLYAASNCFVMPTRGEGWGVPFLEALACERPVIATRWSGHLDFLHNGNSDLIEIDGVLPVSKQTNHEIFIGQCWANPNLEHLRYLMRRAVEHPDTNREKAKRGRQEILQRWSWPQVTPRWTKAFLQFLS